VEDRISELKDKIEIKQKTEELLVKQLKTWERPNLRIMGIEEGEEVQEKGCNIVNKIIAENVPNL
jgi:hypothetical protein